MECSFTGFDRVELLRRKVKLKTNKGGKTFNTFKSKYKKYMTLEQRWIFQNTKAKAIKENAAK